MHLSFLELKYFLNVEIHFRLVLLHNNLKFSREQVQISFFYCQTDLAAALSLFFLGLKVKSL